MIQATGNTGSEAHAAIDQNSISNSLSDNEAAEIKLIEYSDFQCPACAYYHRLVRQLKEDFGSALKFEYHHFPLRKLHQNAELAARSAVAAGRQNKFSEMQDLLFEKQRQWSYRKKEDAERFFVQYAASLNLNLSQFKSDLYAPNVIDKVNQDYISGTRLGVTATPTFFLNGEKIISIPRDYEGFKSLVESGLYGDTDPPLAARSSDKPGKGRSEQ
jgi:protein-disulfide isomerase